MRVIKATMAIPYTRLPFTMGLFFNEVREGCMCTVWVNLAGSVYDQQRVEDCEAAASAGCVAGRVCAVQLHVRAGGRRGGSYFVLCPRGGALALALSRGRRPFDPRRGRKKVEEAGGRQELRRFGYPRHTRCHRHQRAAPRGRGQVRLVVNKLPSPACHRPHLRLHTRPRGGGRLAPPGTAVAVRFHPIHVCLRDPRGPRRWGAVI